MVPVVEFIASALFQRCLYDTYVLVLHFKNKSDNVLSLSDFVLNDDFSLILLISHFIHFSAYCFEVLPPLVASLASILALLVTEIEPIWFRSQKL